jgi:hypothetical protein
MSSRAAVRASQRRRTETVFSFALTKDKSELGALSRGPKSPVADNFAGEGVGSSAGDGNIFATGRGFSGPEALCGLCPKDYLGVRVRGFIIGYFS